jgi:hypothetical protein
LHLKDELFHVLWEFVFGNTYDNKDKKNCTFSFSLQIIGHTGGDFYVKYLLAARTQSYERRKNHTFDVFSRVIEDVCSADS